MFLVIKCLIVTSLLIFETTSEEGVNNGNELVRKLFENSNAINFVLKEMTKTNGKESAMTFFKQYTIQKTPAAPVKVQRCVESLIYAYKNIMSFWAAEMFDSFGKLPSGVLLGGVYWPGSFDECSRVRAPKSPRYPQGFKGRYCRLKRTLIKDPAKLVIGICVPDTCTAEELQHGYTTNLFKTFLKESKILDGISNVDLPLLKNIPAKLPKELSSNLMLDVLSSFNVTCHPDPEPWTSSTIIYMSILIFLLAIIIIGTFADLKPKKIETLDIQRSIENKTTFKVRELLRCFSIMENGRTILSNATTNNKEQLHCVHGIRTITMFWVVLGHSVSIFITITDNLFDLIVESFTLKFVVIFQGFFAVDTFFLLSGFLLSYLFLKEPIRVTKSHVCILYLRRFIRLTPSYMMIIFTLCSFSNLTGLQSVHWEDFDKQRQNCYHSWWQNLLYISNLTDMKDQCLGWGWFLSCDMQFFLISPIFLMYLKSSKKSERKIGFIIIFSILTASWLNTAYLTWKYHLPAGLLFDRHNITALANDISITERYSVYVESIYIKPLTRIQPHTIGCLLGYILFKFKSARLTLKPSYVYLGWFLSCCTMLFTIYYLYWLHLGPTINILHSTFSKSLWAVGVSWVIFACSTGYGGPVDAFLSWEAWRPFSRLTFGAYLLHPLIMTYVFVSYSSIIHFSYGTMIIYFLGFVCLTYMSSFITTISFEVPIAKMEKLFIPSTTAATLTKSVPANDIGKLV